MIPCIPSSQSSSSSESEEESDDDNDDEDDDEEIDEGEERLGVSETEAQGSGLGDASLFSFVRERQTNKIKHTD